MSTENNLYTGKEAREGLMRGIDKTADAVKATLGAGGSNAVLQQYERPFHRITNDGVSVANSIYLSDPLENMGANIIKEIAGTSDKESGDGTTTATTIAQAILHEGMTLTDNPMSIKRSLDECLPIIFNSLDEQKKDISVDEIGTIATISSEDESIGALLQEIYQKIGKDGIIELDNSNVTDTFYDVVDGVRLRGAGYLGAYSTTEEGKAVYKKPLVFMAKEKITSTDQLEELFKQLSAKEVNELVMFVDEIDLGVAGRLAITHLNGGFKTLVIKAPTTWKDWMFEDFAKLTGATPVDFAEGKTFKNFTLDDLGTCDKIITTKEETVVQGTKDISDHIEKLKELGKADDQMDMRAYWLQTKMAILKLGANSDSELSYKRHKVVDAVHACHLALKDGIVAGGGVALRNVSNVMSDTVGGKILKNALMAPMLQIVENAGGGVNEYPRESVSNDSYGFNAKTGELVDMWEAGIVDPVTVVKNSVKNAISVAGTVLTTSVVVTMPKADPLSVLKQALKPEQYG